MILWDVNVLVNARVSGQKHHSAAATVVREAAASAAPFALSDLVLSGYVRVVTSPRVLQVPDSIEDALAFCAELRDRPNARVLASGPRHWAIFSGLCHDADARGGIVADAYHAALAIEHDCEWVSFDRDFARFPGLRWRSPLD